MAETALEVRLRQGPERADVGRFTRNLTSIATTLREIDRAAVQDVRRPRWIISDLSTRDSWLTVRLSIRPDQNLDRDLESLLLPVDALVAGVEELNFDSLLPQYYSTDTVERLTRLGTPSRGINEVVVAKVTGTTSQDAPLSREFLNNAQRATLSGQESIGSVVGFLDILNARNLRQKRSAISISLFDSSTKRAVRGTAPARMSETLREAWGQRVAMFGFISRNAHGQIIRVKVETIRVLPSPLDYPTAAEVLGIAPDWCGDLTVDEFVDEARRV